MSQAEVKTHVLDGEEAPALWGPTRIGLEILVELSKQAFGAFCEDLAGMFGLDIECKQSKVAIQTVGGIAECFGSLVTANAIKAEGPLDGTFHVVFDRGGLFVLAGVVGMHPDQMIREGREVGSLERARNMTEVLAAVGDTLAGSWDRVFRKRFDGEGRYARTATFIGNPWEKCEEIIGWSSDEELLLIACEITVSSHPPFVCGAVFPKRVLARTSAGASDQGASGKGQTQEEVRQETQSPKPVVEESERPESCIATEGANEEPGSEESNGESEIVDSSVVGEDADHVAAGEEQTDDAEQVNEPEGVTSEVGEGCAREEPEKSSEQNEQGVGVNTPDDVAEEGAGEEDAAKDGPAPEDAEETAQSPDAPADDSTPLAEPEGGASEVSEGCAREEAEKSPEQNDDGVSVNTPDDVAEEGASEEDAAKDGPAPEDAEETAQSPDAPADDSTPLAEPEGGASEVSEGCAREEPEKSPEQNDEEVSLNTTDDVAEEGASEEDAAKDGAAPEDAEETAQSPDAPADDSTPLAEPEDAARGAAGGALAIVAGDIMQKEVVWANPDDTVQQVLDKMEQEGSGCAVVGQDGVLEGIVTTCDLRGAMSPYLRPAFAKWRRPLDDATLRIKIKWIMTKPVDTIGPDMPLAAVMQSMCCSGRRVLAVTDQNNDLQGLVTTSDVFGALLKKESNGSPDIAATTTPEFSHAAV